MGVDISVYIAKRNRKTNTWEHIKLYKKNGKKFKLVDIYPFRNYELFDILSGKDDDKFPDYPIVTKDLPTFLRQEVKRCKNALGYYNFKEVNLADLKLYLKEVPKVRDYDFDDDDPNAWTDNPVKNFIERIEQYLDFADPYWDFGNNPASDVKILYWFDR